ncbi:MAG: bifunctional diguanylate cyclase/phosphodiesterase [Gammaproteobacteria bacterium]
MQHSSLSLRARLLLLVLFAVIPAFVLIGYTVINQRQQTVAEAKQHAMNLTQLVVKEQQQLITSTRQLLGILSQLPEVRSGSAAICGQLLAQLRKFQPYYANFAVATPAGQVYCSALPMTKPVNIADLSFYRRLMKTHDFSIGDYQIGRITGVSAINFAYPILGPDKSVRGVVFAALNLSWLNQLLAGVTLPRGSTLTALDDSGTIVARVPDSKRWVGKNLRELPLINAALSHGREETFETKGLDGIARLYAFAPLHNGASGNVYVGVGISKAITFAAADHVFWVDMVWLSLVATLALAAAWLGGDAFFLRRINTLTAAARRLAAGDLGARTGLPHGAEELGQLAHAFDHMSTALQRVNRALKTLSAGNRALVHATEEQALLEQMCQIIVEVGGYRCAWVGYAEQDENKTIRPMAQAGFEGGLESLIEVARYSWRDNQPNQRPTSATACTGTPVIVRDILANPDLAYWHAQARQYGFGAVAAFPLSGTGHTLGVVTIYSPEPGAFDDQEIELLAEATGDLAFGIATLRARVEHERDHETIRHMAYYDALTGLPNHVYFEENMQQALTAAGDQSAALLLLDINRFQEVNDALGFKQGDLLLKDISKRLLDTMGEEAIVARMRGDEFAVLLPIGEAAEAAEMTSRIFAALETPFILSDLRLDISATVGITLFPQDGVEATTLIRHADVAMHQAKKSGQRSAFYATEQDQDSSRRLALAGELRHAIEHGELVLYYQPKVDIQACEVCGAEALVRWIHPQRGLIPPDEFIPLAEYTGLIKPLTDWVLEAALQQSAIWRRAGLALPIAVNISARNLQETEFLEKMERLLKSLDGDARWLEIEITESAIMDDPGRALDILTRLQNLGIPLFIDDFGTGYSSLGYLQRLPVSAIKIDKSFVFDMLTNKDSAAIVRSTITLAHDLDLKVVAEGVENQAMWNRLARLGCDVAQGYYLSKPVPARQFSDWLKCSSETLRTWKQLPAAASD